MQEGQVRFQWREGLALIQALKYRAVDADEETKPLPARALTPMAACHRAGGVEALRKLSQSTRQKLLRDEEKAIRASLARLGDLGLVVWDYIDGNGPLVYRLTELGRQAAERFACSPLMRPQVSQVE